MKLTAKHTKIACYIGYLTQALAVNFHSLLFVRFSKEYNISISSISVLIAVSFIVQLLTDAFEAKFASRLNTRATVVLAHVITAIGLTGYAYLPAIMPSAFAGLLICTSLTAMGAGIVEVHVSAIVEACPTGKKSAAMSYLHSFYCWGLAGVVLLSTLFFATIGIENWRLLAALWAIIPATGAIAFCAVPLYSPDDASVNEVARNAEHKSNRGRLIIFFILMFCAGAAEMAMCQWASTFAETGLGISKSLGDIFGPCAFAVCMGLVRVLHARFSHKINLRKFILAMSLLCTLSYVLAALSPSPAISLIGCALCGLSVGIMWPGIYSLSAVNLSSMGMRVFALLALGGDLGCTVGPSLAGFVADIFGESLSASFLLSAVFPLAITLILAYVSKNWNSAKDKIK